MSVKKSLELSYSNEFPKLCQKTSLSFDLHEEENLSFNRFCRSGWPPNNTAQSTGAVEFIDCNSAEAYPASATSVQDLILNNLMVTLQ